MAEATVTKLEQPEPDYEIPESVVLTDAPDMRLSPNDMRELKQMTGRRLTELTGEGADEADAMQTMAWLKLRRDGNPVPWDRLGDVQIVFEPAEPDPTSGEPSTPSPDSAGSGDSPPDRSTS